MTPAQIAASLTPAQVALLRKLSDGNARRWDDTPYSEWIGLDVAELIMSGPRSLSSDVITDLGRAVLAVLDGGE